MSNKVNQARLALLLAGISQADISRKARVSHAYVSQVVCGHKKPSPKVLAACKELGVTVESMGWGDGNGS